MDFDGWANSLARQFAVIGDAPVPFAVAVILVAIAIWKAFQWRYDAIFERQKEQIAHLERHPSIAPKPVETKSHPEGSLETRPKPSASSELEERVFVGDGVTHASLTRMVRGLNAIQARKLSSPYKGKWIKVSGAVYETGIIMDEIYLAVAPGLKGDPIEYVGELVSAHFSEVTEGLENVADGDFVELVGRISRVNSNGLILTNCELIN